MSVIAVSSSGMVGSLGILAGGLLITLLLITLLVVKELCQHSESVGHKTLARSLGVGIVPLAMVFALTVLLRTLGAIQ